jgi:hypothetical protein
MKEYRGQKYAVSCRQLREQGYSVHADTKHGSYLAANLWWSRKQQEIDRLSKPAPRPLTEQEKLIFAAKCMDPAEWEQAAREMDAARATPEEIARTFASTLAKLAEKAEPETPCMKKHLPPERVQQIEHNIAAIRGEVANPDKSLSTYLERFYAVQRARVDAGRLTAGAYKVLRIRLAVFNDFMGPAASITDLTAAKWEAFQLYLLGRLRRPPSREGWSVGYAQGMETQARVFIKYAWTQCPDCELPRNIHNNFSYGSQVKRITTWTPVEFMHVLANISEPMNLYLLLMANCSFTQKDVADLKDEEVNWLAGTITRSRSKHQNKTDAPVITYRLWPTTWELLQKHRSGAEQVLLTERGTPLYVSRLNADGKPIKSDAISSRWENVRERLDFRRPMKQLRKLGPSLLETHETYGRFAEYMLANSPKGIARRNYIVPPQELFDEAVTWLGRQLGQVPDA